MLTGLIYPNSNIRVYQKNCVGKVDEQFLLANNGINVRIKPV